MPSPAARERCATTSSSSPSAPGRPRRMPRRRGSRRSKLPRSAGFFRRRPFGGRFPGRGFFHPTGFPRRRFRARFVRDSVRDFFRSFFRWPFRRGFGRRFGFFRFAPRGGGAALGGGDVLAHDGAGQLLDLALEEGGHFFLLAPDPFRQFRRL